MSFTAVRGRIKQDIPDLGPDTVARRRLRDLEQGADRLEAAADVVNTVGSVLPIVQGSVDLDPTVNESLTQVGDSPFYWTGNEPVDPRNCELWPNSPYCGGQVVDPFDIREIGFVGKVTVSLCETCFQLDPKFLGISGPSGIVCWRNDLPECQPPPPQPGAEEPPQADLGEFEEQPFYFDEAIAPPSGARLVYACNFIYKYGEKGDVFNIQWANDDRPSSLSERQRINSNLNAKAQEIARSGRDELTFESGVTRAPMQPTRFGYPGNGWANPEGAQFFSAGRFAVSFGHWDRIVNESEISVEFEGHTGSAVIYQYDCNRTIVMWDSVSCSVVKNPYSIADSAVLDDANELIKLASKIIDANYQGTNFNPSTNGPLGIGATRFTTIPRQYQETFQQLESDNYGISDDIVWLAPNGWTYRKPDNAAWEAEPPDCMALYSFNGDNCDMNRRPPGNQPLPTPPKGDDMGCCDETLELLEAIYTRLGVDEFPVKAPALLVQENEAESTLENHAQLWEWQARNLDALMGQFPIKIKVKDSDPTTEGNQEVEIKLPNVAETLAELFGLVYQAETNGDLLVEMLLRLIPEVLATKNASLIGQSYSKANASALGYKINSKEVEVDYNFDLEESQSLPRFLRESKKRLTVPQDDSRESIIDIMAKLEFAAGIIKSAFYVAPSETGRLLESIETMIGDEALSIPNKEKWRDWLQRMNREASRHNKDQSIQPEIIEDFHEGLDKL